MRVNKSVKEGDAKERLWRVWSMRKCLKLQDGGPNSGGDCKLSAWPIKITQAKSSSG